MEQNSLETWNQTDFYSLDTYLQWSDSNPKFMERSTIVYFKHNDIESLQSTPEKVTVENKRAKKLRRYIVVEAVYQRLKSSGYVFSFLASVSSNRCYYAIDVRGKSDLITKPNKNIVRYAKVLNPSDKAKPKLGQPQPQPQPQISSSHFANHSPRSGPVKSDISRTSSVGKLHYIKLKPSSRIFQVMQSKFLVPLNLRMGSVGGGASSGSSSSDSNSMFLLVFFSSAAYCWYCVGAFAGVFSSPLFWVFSLVLGGGEVAVKRLLYHWLMMCRLKWGDICSSIAGLLSGGQTTVY
ncbi:Long chain base biosynthesis protein 1a [Camellia lanceoleosa]|uniref:Long chain base biosynthesis protein 1a n=1 Tax=Camellia lanceoleosa TaxID=1840588 RepID=A0ACC0IM69_9ERIC|nr:Long chain base biosynthesis protein 1a [Camellia lanceoleosa]